MGGGLKTTVEMKGRGPIAACCTVCFGYKQQREHSVAAEVVPDAGTS